MINDVAYKWHRQRGKMDNVISFNEKRKSAKAIITFNDGRMRPKNDTKSYAIIRKFFIIYVLVLIGGSLVFHEFLFAGKSTAVWIFFFIVMGYVLKNGGHERAECQSELQFYDDYLIFYVPKHHISRENDKMEIQKIYYKDVTVCKFRTNIRKMVIYGMIEEINYKYDKNGNLDNVPCYHKNYDGMIKFYTVFDNEHDFKEIIEKNSPLKVEYENS